jgi:hypothetical protein
MNKKYFGDCRVCKKHFESSWKHQKFCSKPCRKSFCETPYIKPYGNIPTGTVGAIGELRVACDLMARGFEVFRAVSPSCSCDLAVIKNGKLFRIEVRTGYISSYSGKRCTNIPKDSTKLDVLAVAFPDKITYTPDF